MASMVSGIQGQLLEVTVVGCSKLRDTEWISRQDPYVCLEYGSTKYRTRTHKDGGKNPVFQEKFVFTLIEGLRDLKVLVWNSNSLSYDDFIGTGMIQLQRVLSQGFDDTPWPLHGKGGRHAGEVRLIMHYSQANKQQKPPTSSGPSAPPYGAPHSPHISPYSVPPPSTASYAHSPASYPAQSPYPAPSPYPAYPPAPAAYPQNPPQSNAYPPPYAPPPSAYPPGYPNSGSSYYPPGPYHGAYPPPPY